MHFTNFLTTAITFAGVALATTNPNPINFNLVDRHAAKPPPPAPLVAGTGPFKHIKATKAAWHNVAAVCGSGKKRGLESRARPIGFVSVPQGQYLGHESEPPIGIYTGGLVTCFGIVIKGTAPTTNPKAKTHWLLHMQATQAAGDWTRFERAVTAVALTGMTGYMSLPYSAAIGTVIDERAWTKEDHDLTIQMVDRMKAAVRALTGHTPVVHMRPMDPPSSMQISGTGEVKAGNTIL